jgi:hypothetical protein
MLAGNDLKCVSSTAGAFFLAVTAVNDRARHNSLVTVAILVLMVLVVLQELLRKVQAASRYA